MFSYATRPHKYCEKVLSHCTYVYQLTMRLLPWQHIQYIWHNKPSLCYKEIATVRMYYADEFLPFQSCPGKTYLRQKSIKAHLIRLNPKTHLKSIDPLFQAGCDRTISNGGWTLFNNTGHNKPFDAVVLFCRITWSRNKRDQMYIIHLMWHFWDGLHYVLPILPLCR